MERGGDPLELDRTTEASAALMALAAVADVVIECGTPGRDPFLDSAACWRKIRLWFMR
ncbi:MAG: hypothetical protein R3D81_16585 [Thalassovita sp.]